MTAFGSGSSGSGTGATRCSPRSSNTRTATSPRSATSTSRTSTPGVKKIGGIRRSSTRTTATLLAKKDLDAVAIVTPDHWHAAHVRGGVPPRARTCTVEKPLSLCVAEGRSDGEGGPATTSGSCSAASKRMSNRRSARSASPRPMRSGAIGKVTAVRRVSRSQNEWPPGIGNPPDDARQEGLRLGRVGRPRAPLRKYNKNRAFYRFRWFYQTTPAGSSPIFGVHYLAQIQARRLGVDAPKAVVARSAASTRTTTTAKSPTRWRLSGTTLVTRSSRSRSSTPPGPRRRPSRARSSFAARRGRCTSAIGGYEIVPEVVTPQRVRGLDVPLDRTIEKGWRVGAKAADRGEEGGRPDPRRRPRPQLPRLREVAARPPTQTSSTATAAPPRR